MSFEDPRISQEHGNEHESSVFKLFILLRIVTFKHALRKLNAAKVFQQNAFKIKYKLSAHEPERPMAKNGNENKK